MVKRHQQRYQRQLQRLQNKKESKTDVFRGKIEQSKLRLMSLEAKKQKVKNNCLFLRINPGRSCMRDFFTD